MTPTILVVDDEPAVTDLLAYNLRKAHYEVLVAADGPSALAQARAGQPDLIVLDLMLPGMDGFEVCRELRKTSVVPIIMLTAQGEEIDRVVGLELGADDYVVKPFSMRELMARIKAVLRRNEASNVKQPTLSQSTGETLNTDGSSFPHPLTSSPLHPLTLIEDQREAFLNGTRLDLSRLEFDLLHLLLTNIERVYTREQLLQQVWGYDFAGDTRAVDSAIKRLRAKLGEDDGIVAVRGIGYKFSAHRQPDGEI